MNKEYAGPVFPVHDPKEEKKLFDKLVDRDYEFLVKDFQRKSNRSAFPDKLRQDKIEKIKDLFSNTSRFPRRNALKELYDRYVNGAKPVYNRGHQDFNTWIQIFVKIRFLEYLRKPGNGTQEPTAPVFALFLHYLMSGRDSIVTRSRAIDDIKALCDKYNYTKSPRHLRNLLIATGTDGPKDPMSEKNIKKVIPLLKKYPSAERRAKKDLESY